MWVVKLLLALPTYPGGCYGLKRWPAHVKSCRRSKRRGSDETSDPRVYDNHHSLTGFNSIDRNTSTRRAGGMLNQIFLCLSQDPFTA